MDDKRAPLLTLLCDVAVNRYVCSEAYDETSKLETLAVNSDGTLCSLGKIDSKGTALCYVEVRHRL
jgi:hypothetical protein